MCWAVPWIGVLVALLGRGRVPASNVPASVRDYVHKAWTQREGAPVNLRDIEQTSDGWYWLGTSIGVCRVGGVTFEKQPIFPGANRQVSQRQRYQPDSGGPLWVLMSYGGSLNCKAKTIRILICGSGFRSTGRWVVNDASGRV
jgi:ligand-binding sensor domain-containing protein